MDEKEYQLEMVEKMARNEDRLNELYVKYAHQFPSRSEFWNSLAKEEVGHGAWIRTLKNRIEDESVKFGTDRFNVDMLNDFYNYVRQQELKIKEGMPLINALVAAKEIEELMLEKKFFEVFHGDSLELQTLLLALEYSTKNHREVVINAWEEERKLISDLK